MNDDYSDGQDGENSLYKILRVKDIYVALPALVVQEVLLMPHLTATPKRPPYMRGVVNIRGDVIPMFDMRVLLGMRSSEHENAELLEMLDAREQDHVRWLQELEKSVRENKEFTLSRDPTRCAFGKWYYSFNPQQFNLASVSAQMMIRAFEVPHRNIHAYADQVLALSGKGDVDGALLMIENARTTTFAELRQLFAELRKALAGLRRELAVIVNIRAQRIGLSVDAAESIEVLSDIQDRAVLGALGAVRDTYLGQIGKWNNRQELAFILDTERLAAALVLE